MKIVKNKASNIAVAIGPSTPHSQAHAQSSIVQEMITEMDQQSDDIVITKKFYANSLNMATKIGVKYGEVDSDILDSHLPIKMNLADW